MNEQRQHYFPRNREILCRVFPVACASVLVYGIYVFFVSLFLSLSLFLFWHDLSKPWNTAPKFLFDLWMTLGKERPKWNVLENLCALLALHVLHVPRHSHEICKVSENICPYVKRTLNSLYIIYSVCSRNWTRGWLFAKKQVDSVESGEWIQSAGIRLIRHQRKFRSHKWNVTAN